MAVVELTTGSCRDDEHITDFYALLTALRPEWHARATCHGKGPDPWFPTGYDRASQETLEVCGGCPGAGRMRRRRSVLNLPIRPSAVYQAEIKTATIEIRTPDDERPVELDDERLPEDTTRPYTASHHHSATSRLYPSDLATGTGDSGFHG